MLELFTQTVLTIGRLGANGVTMLGSGFLVANDGRIATTRHVVGDDDKGVVVLYPKIMDINNYQDTSDNSCTPISAKNLDIDPIRDIAVLQCEILFNGTLPPLSSFDSINVSEKVGVFGFPHCTEGRRVLTYQEAEIGAKILLASSEIKSKYAVINTQARPGQSGSLILSLRTSSVIGMLMGAFIPNGGRGISLGGINPRELHQTTHCISAEYIKAML